jgi:hypothetical protein
MATEIATTLIERGATALIDADPTMTHLQALTTAAVVLAATFPPAAVLVAQQAAQRAWKHRDDPFTALSDYVVELQATT